MSTLFQQPDFLSRSNIYEANIRQYSPEGSFNEFAAHLPRLKEMGMEIIWLMPVHPIGKEKRKGTLGSYYSISDHKAVNSEFGTADELRKLISKAHALEMKVILDWVANHTAWDHVWTRSNPDFFIKDEHGNFKPPFDWDDVLQLDHGSREQQLAMIDAMSYWITEYNIDGFRADLAHLTPLDLWKEARLKLSALKKDLIWLAETEDISYHEAFDISFTWEWMHATEKLCMGEIGLRDCIEILKKYKTDFPENALRMFFTSNHDENSWNGTEYEKYGEYAKAFAVFSCLYPGIPLLYSGQELPNKMRLKFFDKDIIEWMRTNELQEFYKILLELRKRNKAAQAKAEIIFFEEGIDKNILAWRSSAEDDRLLVFLNLGKYNSEQEFDVEDPGKYRDIFSNEFVHFNGSHHFSPRPGEFKVFEKV